MAPTTTALSNAMLTLDQCIARFPDGARPTKKALEDVLREHGLYRELAGKLFLTEDDFADLLSVLRATPTASEADARLGAGRLLTMKPGPNEQGYLVVIGDQLGEDETMFLGWAPDGAVGDLLRLVQYGNPGPLAILFFGPATPAQVDAHKRKLARWRMREDETNWFLRDRHTKQYLNELRSRSYGVVADDPVETTSSGD